uniref:Uncharacterized protein n=1 Tax=Wuchereria bancrofti TaxID=6293 RepID=A0AAF5PRB1_WUCBA
MESVKKSVDKNTRPTGARRHRKRRNKPPPGYDQWDDENKQYYQDVTNYQLKGHPMHADEMKDYKNALEVFAGLKGSQSLDYD